VAAGTWITITLILFGVMSAALAVGLTTALGWVLWHNWPRLDPRSPVRSSRISRSWWSPDHRSVYNGAERRGEL
jgi:hypothetical protein